MNNRKNQDKQLIVLKTANLKKSYSIGTPAQVDVLKGIDLEIAEGEIVAVIGPSGVGKSTLLHVIGALDKPTSGTVEIDGMDIYKCNDQKLAQIRNQTIGFVYQAHHLLPEFTALENVMMPGMIARKNTSFLQKSAMTLLEHVGLQHRAKHRPAELSGGELQRVAVARALCNEPCLLLADEPSGNLDPKTASSLHDLLWNLSHSLHKTLIIVTHNIELANRADRIIDLLDGKINDKQN